MGKWTRRGFIAAGITTGGVLAVGVGVREGHRAPKLAGMMTDGDETLVNVWVKLDQNNIVTAIVPHSEMGQGVFTSMAQMLADEMDADWDKVTFEQAPAHEEYANHALVRDYVLGGANIPGFVQGSLNGAFLSLSKAMSMQITGGSTAVRFTGQGGMRIAGAAAREMLVKAAAKEWDVSTGELRTEKSYIHHDATGKSAPYSEFAVTAGGMSPPTQPTLKAPDKYTLMGTSVPRFDIPSKVDGTAEFGIDVDLPDMKYAAVIGAPIFGATAVNVDDSAAKAMRGVTQIINEKEFVAIIAQSYWHAQQAANALEIEWSTTGREALNQTAIFDQFRADMSTAVTDGKEKTDVKVGNARKAATTAAKTFEAEYTVPYLAHAAMEPINATAHVTDGSVDVWLGHQNPLACRDAIAKLLDIKKENVTIHNRILGGGFGRRADTDYALMVARIAKHVNGPVKMIWSREQDTQQDFYRPATVNKIIAGIGEDGKPLSWDYQYVHKHDPAEASETPYEIEHQLIHHAKTENPIRFGPWRSVDHTQHGFFIESFIDELAHEAGADPLSYRRDLLQVKPRYVAALDTVAKAAQWSRKRPDGIGLGVALVDSFGTVVAQIAEVDVTSGTPRVTHVWAAADPGYVMNPDGFTAQMESGIIYGLTAALYGDIIVENGAIAQSNFHDYEMIRMDDAPTINVTLINSGARLGGGGEPGTPPIAPAVANAIFAASGKRLRSLPLRQADGGLA